MNVRLAKWGNSLAIRLPKPAADAAGIGEGDTLEIVIPSKGRVELSRNRRKPTLKELVSKITPENRHDETDWGSRVGREVW